MTTHHVPTDADRAKANAARRARVASTRPTTRPGSETTALMPGDRVRAARSDAPSGTWGRYAGRTGTVVALNAETFPSGTTDVEIGVCFTLTADASRRQIDNARADAWFRADELEPTP